MKSLTKILCVGAFGIAAMGPFRASAELEVSGSVSIHATADFQAPLAAHGAWIEVGSYGRCWRPAHVEVEWRPYCYGNWVWTDCGWYWASDEPWAWACYHYGSWVYEGGYGWVWVPGIEWAPAWVSWRFGGGYCGWAPLAPHGMVVAPSLFVFVESHHFHEPIRPRTVIVNNTTIINRTTVINNMRSETRTFADGGARKVMMNEGPGAAAIERATNKKLSRVSISEASRQTPVPTTMARRSGEPRTRDSQRPSEQTKPGVDPGRRFSTEAPAEQPKGPGKKSDAEDKLPGAEKRFEEPDQQPSQPEHRDSPPGAEARPGPERGHPQQPPPPGRSQRPPHGKERGRGQGTDRI